MICKPSRLAPRFALGKVSLDYSYGLTQDLTSEQRASVAVRFGSHNPKDQLAAAPQKVERKVVEIKPSEASTVRKKTEEKTVRRRKPSIDYEPIPLGKVFKSADPVQGDVVP